MISRRLSSSLVLLLSVLAACGSPPPDPDPAAEPAPEPIWLVDVAAAAGLTTVQVGGSDSVDWIISTVGSGGAWLDYDGDGDADLYLAQGATEDNPLSGPPDQLYRNDGDPDGDGIPSFTDVTVASGLGDVLWSFGVAVADYDNDGDPDLYLMNWGINRLYRNNGNGTFTDVAAAAGVADESWGVSGSWGDADRDGDLDLFVTNYVEFDFDRYPPRGEVPLAGNAPPLWRNMAVVYGPRGLVAGKDVYFRNDGDPDGDGIPTFRNATEEAGLVPWQESYGLGTRFFDANDDGDLDLYVANDSLANAYFANLGDGTFREQGVITGLAYNEQGHEQAGMGIDVGDYNGDGLSDLVVTNFSHDHDTLYRNDGDGVFTDVSFPAGLGGMTYLSLGWGAEFCDLDQDGREDLFVAHGHVYPQVDERDMGTKFRQPNSLYLNVDGERFEEITERGGPGLQRVESSRAVLPVDIDGDGDLDLAVTEFNATPQLLRNDGAPGHWLQVRLVGSRSNRDGIGARVTIEAGGRRQVREITRTASFAGSILPVAHFGLGQVDLVERLEVRWPLGNSTLQEGIAVDRLVVIHEPDDG